MEIFPGGRVACSNDPERRHIRFDTCVCEESAQTHYHLSQVLDLLTRVLRCAVQAEVVSQLKSGVSVISVKHRKRRLFRRVCTASVEPCRAHRADL